MNDPLVYFQKPVVAKKTRSVMRSTNPTIKENIMAETNNQTQTDVTPTEVEAAPTRLQVFVNKHPRAARVIAITGGVAGLVGVVQVTRTLQANKDHLASAADHAGMALDQVAASVDPASPEA